MRLKGSKVTSKFTLQRAKLPHQEKGREVLLFNEEEPTTDKITDEKRIELQELITEEDKIYSRMLEINPLIVELVGTFNLVYSSINEKPKRVLKWATEEPQKTTFKPQPIEEPQPKIKRAKKGTIGEFTARLLEGYNSYSREEIMERIITDTGIDKARAFKEFINMRKEKTIFKTPFNTYYLSNSTPF